MYEIDTTFSSTRNARTIYLANNKLNSLGIVQDAAGNVWIGGYYDDNTNNFNKAFLAAFNGINGQSLTTYNGSGTYYHNQYDYNFVRSLYKAANGKVYAAFTVAGGALLDATSNGLDVNKVGFGTAPQCRAYAQRNDTTIVGVTAAGGANPSQNRFYAFNAMAGSNFATHQFANYYDANANNFNSNLLGSRVIAMQPDGKMLVATTPYEVYRFKANSSQLDSTFGNNGYAYIVPNSVPSNPCDVPQAADMLVQPNGSILYLLGNGAYSQLYKLNSDGTVDNAFNNNSGVVTLSMSYTALSPCVYSGTVCSKIIRLSSGKIIVAGTELANASITYNPQGVNIMNGDGLGFFAYNPDGTADITFGGGSNYLRVNIWGSTFNYYENPQLNEVYVNAADEIFVTGRYAVLAAGTPTGEDAAYVMKLKPTQTVNPCTNFSFAIDATPAQNQDSTNGIITISNITGSGPYTVAISLNGVPYSSGSFSTLPIYIDDIPASTTGYDVLVSNADGCSNTGNALVASCFNFNAQTATTPATNTASCDGAVTVTIAGSWGSPYTATAGFLSQALQFNSSTIQLSNTLCVGTGYSVSFTDGYGCQTTALFNITTACSAPPTPTITQSNDTLYADTTGVSGGYDWYLNGIVVATTNFPVNYIVVTQNGSYTVVAGNGPCVSAASAPLVVTKVGINHVTKVDVNVFPNPARDVLVIHTAEEIASLEIYNMLGEKVKAINGQVTQVNVASFNAGVYSIRLITSTGLQAVKTFVKE